MHSRAQLRTPMNPAETEVTLGQPAYPEPARAPAGGRETLLRPRRGWIAVDWREYVEVAPGGAATIRGTDLTVAAILDELAAGSGPDEVARDHPPVTRQAVEAAILYAAEQMRR